MMTIHQIVIDEDRWTQGGHRSVAKYHLDPPLPADAFAYVITTPPHERKQVVTNEPYITESTAELSVPLVTAVFPETVNRDRFYGPGSHRIPESVKKIRVTGRVRALRYGGSLFLYGGLIDQNPPQELPLEVLEWKMKFQYGDVRYECGRDAYNKIRESKISSIPSAYDVCAAEGRWPQQPYLNTDLERFFFQRWLRDRSLTLQDALLLYEAELLVPYRQALAQYEIDLAECASYYDQWLERNGVLLVTEDEIWEYLRDEALPAAAQEVEERARRVLEEAGHPEFLSQVS